MRNCPNYTAGGIRDLWLFFLAPMMGGAFATILQLIMFSGERPAAHLK
jgi:hypothetical protein